MTGMLASVTDDLECEMAITAGVDIIDLKDPANGALGAFPPNRISSIVSKLAGRRPVSATLGDLPADPVLLRREIQRCAGSGVDYVKIGVFSFEHIDACLEAAVHSSRNVALIAVFLRIVIPPCTPCPNSVPSALPASCSTLQINWGEACWRIWTRAEYSSS